ncbi:Hypothetical predicted protein [Podarcis lilfordi]|uniref:Uncharacterized protein n=1 Tax=Podarcis lilfordi TaxID=74358 RepID=A0AA35JVD1_9SAUR|nr:Hypothetical predicted protein [Podarcis lilfordi]
MSHADISQTKVKLESLVISSFTSQSKEGMLQTPGVPEDDVTTALFAIKWGLSASSVGQRRVMWICYLGKQNVWGQPCCLPATEFGIQILACACVSLQRVSLTIALSGALGELGK